MKRPTIRQLVRTERPLVLPGAHDALSALLIQQAGCKGYFLGGFQTAGARYGLPDIGLMQLGELAAAYRDVIQACDLPVLVDADNGYGDVTNCVHVLHTYERMGASALFLEDQASPKRCGHLAGKQVVPAAEMEAKIRALAANWLDPETFIVARTDARAPSTAWTRRCGAPSATCARAPTRSSSRRWRARRRWRAPRARSTRCTSPTCSKAA